MNNYYNIDSHDANLIQTVYARPMGSRVYYQGIVCIINYVCVSLWHVHTRTM